MSSNILTRELRDKIAVTLSMLCILQCLFVPFLVTLLPLMDLWWLSDHFLHPFLLLVVIPLTLLTLIPGHFRHKSFLPLLLSAPALIMLIIGAFMPESTAEKLLTVAGALVLATAHIKNMSLHKNCRCSTA